MTSGSTLGAAASVYQEYLRVTNALSAANNGGNITTLVISSVGFGPGAAVDVNLPVPAIITTLLQNRQTALASQLAAMGITP